MTKAPVPSSRKSMADLVTNYLHEQIVSGALAPGERITELHLARQFQTSQGPVREAIRRLEGMGLLTTERFKRSCVREITAEEIQEAYAVRAALEALAASECVRSHLLDLHLLHSLAEDARKAAQKRNRARYIRANTAFHRAIVQQSRNSILLQSWDALNLQVRTRARIERATEEDLLANQEMHWPILDALAAGEGAKAARLLRRHVLQFARKPGV